MKPAAVKFDPSATIYVPNSKSRVTIGGPDGIVIVSPTVAPNRFWRAMQRWCLGIVWEIIDDEKQTN